MTTKELQAVRDAARSAPARTAARNAARVAARNAALPEYVFVVRREEKTGRPIEVSRKKALELMATGAYRVAGKCE